MKALLNILTLIVTVVIALATCVTYYSSYIEPDKLGTFVLIQYAFPYLWVVNIIVLVLQVILRPNWRIAIPVLAAIVTFNGAISVFNISTSDIPKDKKTIKVLTYNVHYMSMAPIDSIGSFLEAQNADILCLQECDARNYKKIKKWVKAYPYMLAHSAKKKKNISGDKQLLLSKYPIKENRLGGDIDTYIQRAEVTIGGEKITILNCHLASIGLHSEEIKVFDPSLLPEQEKSNVKKQLKTTHNKMRDAYHRRQEQTRDIAKTIESISTPILLCGDFNDTPISYTYQVVHKRGMKDSFIEAGNGLGNTYNGNLPPIRIDYIWHTDDMEAVYYKEHRVEYSDHFPVCATIVLKD
ncbi:MAG: endonuclease/exonuclease/phosphatase family protein [Bacteroidia bacterium]|nr:endonuclease/exonuclease/phosphatase family protein [Bacteroidia bacterium]